MIDSLSNLDCFIGGLFLGAFMFWTGMLWERWLHHHE